ncbi:MAG: J domain-containing protein, partial [Myxococcales bacterium]|nr:J domain-containing protein [Myxococcales bacterium]
MSGSDLYGILGIARSATDKEIKAAYRKLAKQYHPDLNPGNAEAEEKFKQVSAAFEVLGKPEKRKLYDEFGMDGLRDGFNPEQARAYGRWSSAGAQGAGGGFSSFGDFSSVLEELFGGGGYSSRAGF